MAFTNYLENILGDDAQTREALRLIPVFKSSSDDLLKLIFQNGKLVHLQPDEDLIKEGEFDQWIFVILKGALSVFVQGRNIDKISSLVGERCLLGEPRSATLKANGEVYAFGVDMSFIYNLTQEGTANSSRLALVEFLSLIIEQALERVMNLWFTLSYLKEYGKQNLESVGEKQLLEAFFSGDLEQHPSIMSYLWLLVKKSLPSYTSVYWDLKEQNLDLRRLAAHLSKSNQQNFLLEWSNELFNWCQRNKLIDFTLPYEPEFLVFDRLYSPVFEALSEHIDPAWLDEIQAHKERFLPLERKKVSLGPLRSFLLKKGITTTSLTDAFFLLLKTTLDLNQKLNSQIHQISRTHYLGAFLESAYFDDKKLFFVSKMNSRLTTLDELYVHLIEPYMRNLELMRSQTQEPGLEPAPAPAPAAKPASHDPSNFDELVKMLGSAAPNGAADAKP